VMCYKYVLHAVTKNTLQPVTTMQQSFHVLCFTQRHHQKMLAHQSISQCHMEQNTECYIQL